MERIAHQHHLTVRVQAYGRRPVKHIQALDFRVGMHIVQNERPERLGPSFCKGTQQLAPVLVGGWDVGGRSATRIWPRAMQLAAEDIGVTVGLVSGDIEDCKSSAEQCVSKCNSLNLSLPSSVSQQMHIFKVSCHLSRLNLTVAASGGDDRQIRDGGRRSRLCSVPRDGYDTCMCSVSGAPQNKMLRAGRSPNSTRDRPKTTRQGHKAE